MAKRKRGNENHSVAFDDDRDTKRAATATTTAQPQNEPAATFVQIVTGSYERVLHGIVAAVPHQTLRASPGHDAEQVTFADSFLFNAHTSSIRCLAISPPSDDSPKVLLATGSTDERINLYNLSRQAPRSLPIQSVNGDHSKSSSLLPPIASTALNKELGMLNHHSSTVTKLSFPTRTKLFSADAANNLTILRTRDWAVLSTLKAPTPKQPNRPSGDTATASDIPAGFNDFAVHPSLKLMLSVGRGERCMRLWNLVLGKKAGVLQFDKSLLRQVGESKYSSGEGRIVSWDAHQGDLFAVGFERGAVVFGQDCQPRRVAIPSPRSKIHQLNFIRRQHTDILVLSTEDGRILLFDAQAAEHPPQPQSEVEDDIAHCRMIGQFGGRADGIESRIRDFRLLTVDSGQGAGQLPRDLIIAACSDGSIKLYTIDFQPGKLASSVKDLLGSSNGQIESGPQDKLELSGQLIGIYETANRITCIEAFVLDGQQGDEEVAEALSDSRDSTSSISSDDDDD